MEPSIYEIETEANKHPSLDFFMSNGRLHVERRNKMEVSLWN